MDLIQRAYQQNRLGDSANTDIRKIFQLKDQDENQDDDDMESMLAYIGDKVIELVLSTLVYKHRLTLNHQHQIRAVNALANNLIISQKIADYMELRKVIQQVNSNINNINLTNQMLYRKMKAVMGFLAICDSWDHLRDRTTELLSDDVKNFIIESNDKSKSRNGSVKESETRRQLNRRSVQTPIKHQLEDDVEKLGQDFRRTLLGNYPREDDIKYSTYENRLNMDQSLRDESPSRQYKPESEFAKRETITNNSSPGSLTYKSQRHTVTPKEQRVFSAISGSTCTLPQFKQYVAELPDIDARNSGKQGDTPLMLLLKKPQLREDDEIPKIQVLLSLGASWTAKNNVGLDANAISQRHDLAIINKLKNTKMLDVDDRASIGESPDSYVVAPIMQKMFSGVNGDTFKPIQFEEAVIQVGPNVDSRNSGKKGDTALMMLLRKEVLDPQRDIPKIRILLKYGASWEATNNRGETARQLAAKHSDEVLEMIGLQPDSTDSKSVYSENAASKVIKNDSTPARPYVSQRLAPRNFSAPTTSSNNLQQEQLTDSQLLLIDAIKTRKRSLDEVERLVTRIDNLNFNNDSEIGDTPLMMMLRHEKLNSTYDIPICKTLIDYGASWNCKNKLGQSARDLTRLHNAKVIAEIENN